MNSKTDIAKTLSPLAEAMKAKEKANEPPYVLCLGEGATLSSGCRAMRWAVRVTLAEERPWVLDDELAEPEKCGHDSAKFEQLLETLGEDQWYDRLLPEFFNLLDHSKGQDRMMRLERFLTEAYPSPGYHFLALLAREGFFQTIFNANYDPLLQLALDRFLPSTDDQGRPMQPYERLINRRDPSVEQEIKDAFDLRRPRIKALWLHGHMWERSGIAFTRRETADWYPNVQDVVEKHFAQDLLLIGYTDRDIDIFQALLNARREGNVWYVAPARPDTYVTTFLGARTHQIISGQAGDFDTFCKVLFDLTLDLTDPKQVQRTDTHRRELLEKKQSILQEYVHTLQRRMDDDPMAPPSLRVQQDAMQREAKAIEEALR